MRLGILIILPLLPLTLTMIPLDQMIDRAIKSSYDQDINGVGEHWPMRRGKDLSGHCGQVGCTESYDSWDSQTLLNLVR